MQLFVGLMSGTSADAIDAALVSFDNHSAKLEHFLALPYSTHLKEKIAKMRNPVKKFSFTEIAELDIELGETFADAAEQLLLSANIKHDEITAIGSHGQTIFHSPDSTKPFTLQLANPNTIAALTSITTIADFRSMDIAVGGQGAPLVPAFHADLFRTPEETRVVLNLGGIANISLLPASLDKPILGFDTGPANCLMDDWILKNLNVPYDDNGSWGQQGSVIPELLHIMLADEYFHKPHPKSTGREYFNLNWLVQKQGSNNYIAEDIQATLQRLTISSVASSVLSLDENIKTMILCGGGAQNQALTKLLSAALPKVTIKTTNEYGVDADGIEAMAFAWLAKRRLESLSGNLPSVTGADKEVLLGGIYG